LTISVVTFASSRIAQLDIILVGFVAYNDLRRYQIILIYLVKLLN